MMPSPSLEDFICPLSFRLVCGESMFSSKGKSIYSVPKWTSMYVKTLRSASSSSFLKWPSLFGSKTSVHLEAEQGTPGRTEYYVPRKFVPMTRKALIRRIVEDENLVNTKDRHYFQDLAVHLDKAIAGTFHGVLGELKVRTLQLKEDREVKCGERPSQTFILSSGLGKKYCNSP